MAHEHNVFDTDPHFVIDAVTKKITTSSPKVQLAKDEHKSERFTFEAPRNIDGHDMTLCNKVRVHYINVSNTNKEQKSADLYEVEDFQVNPNDETKVVCSWLIKRTATKYAGSLSFVVEFACMSGDKIDYSWRTLIYSGISVADGINNAEIVADENSDVLEAWLQRILDAGGADIVQTTGNDATKVMSQKASSNAFANALKGTASGEAVAITDVSPLEHRITVKVRGKNLIPFPYERPAGTSVTKSGVTFTTNADGSITLNGTATGNIFHTIIAPYLELQDGIYTLSGAYRNDTNRAALCIRNPGDTIMADSESTSAKYDTQTAGNIVKEAYLYIYNGSTFDNITIYPQLEEGTIATAYAPYVEDISTVQVGTCGKNVFFTTTERKEYKGITAEKTEDGTFHVYGTSDGTGDFWMDMNINLPRGRYTGSGCPKGGSSTTWFIEYYNQNTGKGKIDYGDGVEFDTSATQTIVVHLVVRNGQTVDLVFKPMIELGTGDKVYEPFKAPAFYIPDSNGETSVKSVFPVTTLLGNTDGVIIDCTYNRDINKAFAELYNAIISTGGNV